MKNAELLRRAKLVMPGGVSSPVRAFRSVGGDPRIIRKSYGPYLIDVDNNKYIDYCMSFGPLIAGHSHPNIISTLKNAVENGTSYGATNEQEIILAERITNNHPAVDWVRFVNSGTEAVMSALRLARAKTKRSKIVKFDGCYHGHVDSLLVKAGSGLATFGIVDSAGVSKDSNETIVLELGNIEALESCINDFGNEIACIIIEGIPANNGLLIQTKEFMKQIERKAHEIGAIFILDEVITGFRLGLTGATGYYDLHPDLVTFGKIIGGGLPIGAYGGKNELMDLVAPLGPMYQAGTLSGNPIAVAAGNSTLQLLETKKNIYNDLSQRRKNFTDQLQDLLIKFGFNVHIPSIESIFWIVFQDEEVNKPSDLKDNAIKIFNNFHSNLISNGLYLPPSAYEVCFFSLAHTEEIINESLKLIENSLKEMTK